MEEEKKLKLCSYPISMQLKKLGFNEPCDYLYTTAIRHNGEDLDSDEQYELEAEGRKDEIEYVPGGWLDEHYNRNDFDYFSDETCSAPLLNDVVDWLEKEHGLIINATPSFGIEFDEEYEIKSVNALMGWHTIVYYADGQKPLYIMDIRKNRYEAIANGVEEALELLKLKNGNN